MCEFQQIPNGSLVTTYTKDRKVDQQITEILNIVSPYESQTNQQKKNQIKHLKGEERREKKRCIYYRKRRAYQYTILFSHNLSCT